MRVQKDESSLAEKQRISASFQHQAKAGNVAVSPRLAFCQHKCTKFSTQIYIAMSIYKPQRTDFERQHIPMNPIQETEAPIPDYTLVQHHSESGMKEQ